VLSGHEKSQVHAVLLMLKGHSCRLVGRHDLLLAATGSKRLTGHWLSRDTGPVNMQGDSAVLVQAGCSFEVDIHCPGPSQPQVHFVFVHRQAQFELTSVYVLAVPGVSVRFSWCAFFVLVAPEKTSRPTNHEKKIREKSADTKRNTVSVSGWINMPTGRKHFDPVSKKWLP